MLNNFQKLEANGEVDDEAEEEPFDIEGMLQEEFADELQVCLYYCTVFWLKFNRFVLILKEEEQVEEVVEDEVKDNMITDIKNNFENQMNLIEASKVELFYYNRYTFLIT